MGGKNNPPPSVISIVHQHDADLRKIIVAAGLNPDIRVEPLHDPQGHLGEPPPSIGYFNPPRPSQQFLPGSTDQLPFVSGSQSGMEGQSGQFSTVPPSASSETQLSMVAIARTKLEEYEMAFVDKVYAVQAGVSRSKIENFEGEPFDLALNDTTKSISFDILLHASKNIELLQGWQKRLHYNPSDLEVQSVEFPFKAVTPGRTSLDINFYHERHWLRTVHFEFDAIEQTRSTSVFSEV